MEVSSSAIATVFPIKRKAESDPAEEIEESSGEIEENSNEIEESGDDMEESGDGNEGIGDEFETVESLNEYFKSRWITPEWDVDSFDGREYDSSEEETEEIEEGDKQDWRRFKRQHIENKGFYVDRDLWPMYKYTNHRVVRDLERPAGDQTHRQLFSEMACLCLQKYNQDMKSKDENFVNVEFVEVVGGVYTPTNLPKSYITFKARAKPDGPLVDYQAKVWSTMVQHEHYPILCRRAPPPKPSN